MASSGVFSLFSPHKRHLSKLRTLHPVQSDWPQQTSWKKATHHKKYNVKKRIVQIKNNSYSWSFRFSLEAWTHKLDSRPPWVLPQRELLLVAMQQRPILSFRETGLEYFPRSFVSPNHNLLGLWVQIHHHIGSSKDSSCFSAMSRCHKGRLSYRSSTAPNLLPDSILLGLLPWNEASSWIWRILSCESANALPDILLNCIRESKDANDIHNWFGLHRVEDN